MTTDKIQRVLLTTDLSEASWSALPLAEQVARNAGAELHVCCVVQEPFDKLSIANEAQIREAHQAAQHRVEGQVLGIVEERIPDMPVQVHVFHSTHPEKEIVERARELGADVIVMATHGRSGMKGLLIGSTTEKVVRQAKLPVLTVPAVDPTEIWP